MTKTLFLSIPSYYRSSEYAFQPSHPTTKAEYIALQPSTNPYIEAKNEAIARDAKKWGWHTFKVDVTSPQMQKWWEEYQTKARVSTWHDDLWRIWQREHSVKIAQQKEAEEAEAEQEPTTKMGAVKNGVKKWMKRQSQNSQEQMLRRYEEKLSEAKRNDTTQLPQDDEVDDEEKTTMKQGSETNSSQTSLPESFMAALERMNNADNVERPNPNVLQMHSWLYRQ